MFIVIAMLVSIVSMLTFENLHKIQSKAKAQESFVSLVVL